MSQLKNINSAVSLAAAVNYKISVLDASGRVARELPRKRNLILDQGLNGVAARSWAASFSAAVVGTGTTPVKRDSGAVTFSRSGSTVTASAGFFEADDVGRLIKFDSGEEMYVTAFSSSTQVTVNQSGAIAASEGTVWYVNQTGLASESKRTTTYASDSGANGTSFAVDTITHKRTFIFSAESGSVTYREVGWSHTTSAGANLFGRDLIAGGGVALVAGQQLKVEVELSVTLSPVVTPAAVGAVITGWPASTGYQKWEGWDCDTVLSNGGGGVGSGWQSSGDNQLNAGTSTAALAGITQNGFGISGRLDGVALTAQTYVAGSFTRTWVATFSVGKANSAAIRSLWVGLSSNSYFRILFDSAQTKDSSHTLTVTLRMSWGRVLTN